MHTKQDEPQGHATSHTSRYVLMFYSNTLFYYCACGSIVIVLLTDVIWHNHAEISTKLKRWSGSQFLPSFNTL